MASVHFTAKGAQLAAFRDALRRNGVRCRNQQVSGEVFSAEISAGDQKMLHALAAHGQIAVEITARRGLRYRLTPFRGRWGFLCGMLLGSMFLFWCNAAVRSIEITGNTRIPDAEIIRALSELGVSYGVPFRDLPYRYIEQQMRLAVHDIEWITMRHRGGRLIVDLTEERLPPAMDERRIPANIVAAETAQITGMDIRSGFAAKQVGDTVRAGDLLISGAQTDAFGICRYYHAEGTVTGTYFDTFEQMLPYVSELPVRGSTETETVLSVFGRRIPLTLGFVRPAPAENLIYEEDREPFFCFGRQLPVSLIRCRYTRQETAITVFTEAELRAMLTESAERYVQNFHADDRLISKNIRFSQSDLGISLKINYVFEGVIGKSCEIFVKLS
ncbi:MAG: sporulation protein YqfD [Oscillospiraceae bacterium]|nr:sporulation protein YqfD [Oscillospiraceae bacterium]